MADAKDDMKRKCIETVDGQPEQKQKKKRIDESTDSNNHVKITDLNQFCLEKIFAHLSLEDLLNVSDSNKYLRSATRMPFVWNYAGKSVSIDQQNIRHYSTDKEIIMFEPGDEDIVILNLKIGFQMLRCFGGLITELKFKTCPFFTRNSSEIYKRLVSYINEFCAESLKKVTFDEGLGFEDFEKPFLNVEDLTIHTLIHLKEKCLSALFPKLNRLHSSNCNEDDLSVLSEYFPNLHHLKMGVFVSNYDNLSTIFQLNPHIRSLYIGISNFSNFKSFGERYLQSIESLHISRFKAQEYDNSIHLPNVEKFKITYTSINEPIPNIPFSFNGLKEFEIMGGYASPEFFITFINENPMIEKLKVTCARLLWNVLSTGDLVAALPFLKLIDFHSWFGDTRNALPIILPYVEFLRRFTFSTGDTDEEIRAGCGDKWRFYRNEEYNEIVTLERNDVNVNELPLIIN